ncbi:hypothetical protein IMAU70004_01371 [Lactiplantibacillus plantarum]|nr:hypothetical protein [Lactiplantibacillus plantarum]
MGLSPKPVFQPHQLGWKDLDDFLLTNFKAGVGSISISPLLYSMNLEEIVNELESKGYNVETQGDCLKIS